MKLRYGLKNKCQALAAALLLAWGCAAPAATPADDGAGWRLTPRLGVSQATGLLGLELQHGHWGAAIGVLPVCIWVCDALTTYGLSYRLRPGADTWGINLFAWRWQVYGGHDQLLGVALEYRWQWRSGWDVTLGLGAGQQGKGVEPVNPLLSWSVGYSF